MNDQVMFLSLIYNFSHLKGHSEECTISALTHKKVTVLNFLLNLIFLINNFLTANLVTYYLVKACNPSVRIPNQKEHIAF